MSYKEHVYKTLMVFSLRYYNMLCEREGNRAPAERRVNKVYQIEDTEQEQDDIKSRIQSLDPPHRSTLENVPKIDARNYERDAMRLEAYTR